MLAEGAAPGRAVRGRPWPTRWRRCGRRGPSAGAELDAIGVVAFGPLDLRPGPATDACSPHRSPAGRGPTCSARCGRRSAFRWPSTPTSPPPRSPRAGGGRREALPRAWPTSPSGARIGVGSGASGRPLHGLVHPESGRRPRLPGPGRRLPRPLPLPRGLPGGDGERAKPCAARWGAPGHGSIWLIYLSAPSRWRPPHWPRGSAPWLPTPWPPSGLSSMSGGVAELPGLPYPRIARPPRGGARAAVRAFPEHVNKAFVAAGRLGGDGRPRGGAGDRGVRPGVRTSAPRAFVLSPRARRPTWPSARGG